MRLSGFFSFFCYAFFPVVVNFVLWPVGGLARFFVGFVIEIYVFIFF